MAPTLPIQQAQVDRRARGQRATTEPTRVGGIKHDGTQSCAMVHTWARRLRLTEPPSIDLVERTPSARLLRGAGGIARRARRSADLNPPGVLRMKSWISLFALLAALSLTTSACKGEPQARLGPAPNPALAPAAGEGHEAHGAAAAPAEAAAGGAEDSADAGPRGDAAKGKVVFERVCQACHQADGTGMNGMLAANFKTDPSRLKQKDSKLLHSIAEGFQGAKLMMPPQKTVTTEQERKDALAYLRATFGG